jgi:hypothetical protein
MDQTQKDDQYCFPPRQTEGSILTSLSPLRLHNASASFPTHTIYARLAQP